VPTDLDILAADAQGCRACPLWEHATQVVFGEGPERASAVLVGEQPGDQEDLAGRPFVGPAGRVLDDALKDAGVDRSAVYVTNAVKHFKWKPRGKRRIHDKPNRTEVVACHRWLEAEIEAVRPELVVTLGAVAAQSIFGPSFRVTRQRGVVLPSPLGPEVVATIHPSAVLRASTGADRTELYDGLVADLRIAAERLRAA
jgi:uracil-DNA glycosylase